MTKPATINLEEDAAPAPAADLKNLVNLATKLSDQQKRIEQMEEQLKREQELLKRMEEEIVPSAMLELGVTKLSLEDGTLLTLDDVLRGSIPTVTAIEKEKDPMQKDAMRQRRTGAFRWLQQNGGAALIKSTVEAIFGKGEEAKALVLAEQLAKKGFTVHKEDTVHFQTLNAFLREKVGAGAKVPFDLFSVYAGKRAVIVQPKTK